jgi:anti-sigma B factor antagonist|tara:strand:- start:84 stop:422 length:339 start_codon:yes stop_codon:yes gene_type:complete
MDITEEDRDGICILHIKEPRLDAARAPALREELTQRINAGQHRLILDLSAATFMDSSGLGALVSAMKLLGPRGNLALIGVQGAVERLLRLTRMEQVFIVEPNADAAITRMLR